MPRSAVRASAALVRRSALIYARSSSSSSSVNSCRRPHDERFLKAFKEIVVYAVAA
jgi:hypothetical protein